jgi:fatty-acyl-CoA synthase
MKLARLSPRGDNVNGLMLDYELTIPAIVRRAESLFGHRKVTARLEDRSLHEYDYAELLSRSKRLGDALRGLGLVEGDRVATLCWNHHRHLEAYIGIPCAGLITHTLNLRLHPDDLVYIASDAGDRALIVDESLLPLYDKIKDRSPFEHVIVVGNAPPGMISYEELLQESDRPRRDHVIDERSAAVMCYTSGTTGRPKGVLYSHRAIALHSLASAMAGTLDIRTEDVVLPVVPMFHANAWGYPFSCALVGASQVLPGPFLDPESLLDLFESCEVTLTAGVPTIWSGILDALDKEPQRWNLSHMRMMVVGGGAAPRSMIEGFERRHGLSVVHAWGMTEMTPLGTVSHLPDDLKDESDDVRFEYRTKQGLPAPFVETRARSDVGIIPWDGVTYGELEVRGPWIASSYFGSKPNDERWTEDGWFRTGDIVTIDERGYIEIKDRAKDLIKSGGEWISSLEIETALMSHPDIAEAAVIATPDAKWQERPLAVVVVRSGHSVGEDQLKEYLAARFAKWWLPDTFQFANEIPKTAVGKFNKVKLRALYVQTEPDSAQ